MACTGDDQTDVISPAEHVHHVELDVVCGRDSFFVSNERTDERTNAKVTPVSSSALRK